MESLTLAERLERAKKKIIELEVRRKRESVQNGHCPYSHLYCGGIEHPEKNCDDVDCDECTADFFREYEKRVTKRINRDF